MSQCHKEFGLWNNDDLSVNLEGYFGPPENGFLKDGKRFRTLADFRGDQALSIFSYLQLF